MQFLLMDYVCEQSWRQISRDEQDRWLGAYRAYMQAMLDAGILVHAKALKPSSAATTVRIREGQTQVLDGPYADSKEQLGGYHLIEVSDFNAALAWAARSPTALHGVIEVRPVSEEEL